jgi:hypothetical protein
VKIFASTYRCESTCRMSSGLKSSQQEGNSMIAYQSTLLGRTEVAEDTMALRFEKPRSFLFKAGQYIDLALELSSAPCPFCPSVPRSGSRVQWALLLFITIQPGQLSCWPAESGSRHSLVSFFTLQRRGSVILFFCSTRTATWKMLRSWMHSRNWSGLIPGSGLFLPSRASPIWTHQPGNALHLHKQPARRDLLHRGATDDGRGGTPNA